jgi:hypothetical protein
MLLIRHFCWQSSGSVDLDQGRSVSWLALHVVKSTVNVTARSVAATDTALQSASVHCPAQTRQPPFQPCKGWLLDAVREWERLYTAINGLIVAIGRAAHPAPARRAALTRRRAGWSRRGGSERPQRIAGRWGRRQRVGNHEKVKAAI